MCIHNVYMTPLFKSAHCHTYDVRHFLRCRKKILNFDIFTRFESCKNVAKILTAVFKSLLSSILLLALLCGTEEVVLFMIGPFPALLRLPLRSTNSLLWRLTCSSDALREYTYTVRIHSLNHFQWQTIRVLFVR